MRWGRCHPVSCVYGFASANGSTTNRCIADLPSTRRSPDVQSRNGDATPGFRRSPRERGVQSSRRASRECGSPWQEMSREPNRRSPRCDFLFGNLDSCRCDTGHLTADLDLGGFHLGSHDRVPGMPCRTSTEASACRPREDRHAVAIGVEAEAMIDGVLIDLECSLPSQESANEDQ